MARGRRAPRIYFAGPSQHSYCSWLNGHRVLESFANTSELMERYRPTFQSMVLEAGIIANLHAARKGKPPAVELESYMEFAQQHGGFYDWVAAFDYIEEGPEVNRRAWLRMKDAGIPNLLPVFHQGEPWSLLQEYCAGSDWLGLGLQRPFRDGLSWLDECFSRIPARTRVHGFAMTSFTRFPFWSVDSTTWLHEVLALMQTGGQGRSALEYLTMPELVGIVVKKYQRMAARDVWRGVFGIEAGRGFQIDMEDVLAGRCTKEGDAEKCC